AGASAEVSALTPFPAPPAAASPAGQGAVQRRGPGAWRIQAAPDVVSSGSQVMSVIPEALRALCSSPLDSFEQALFSAAVPLSKQSSLSAPLDFAIRNVNAMNKAAALRCLAPNQAVGGGATIAVAVGRGTSIGMLSVPRAWTKSATPAPVATESLPAGWVSEPIRLVGTTAPPQWPSCR
ncbi:MAG: hypothetical protein PHQ28_11910, partial [Mycobacterium sp.]|nr:hypothetical protein [Mycobacterium sp.]